MIGEKQHSSIGMMPDYWVTKAFDHWHHEGKMALCVYQINNCTDHKSLNCTCNKNRRGRTNEKTHTTQVTKTMFKDSSIIY